MNHELDFNDLIQSYSHEKYEEFNIRDDPEFIPWHDEFYTHTDIYDVPSFFGFEDFLQYHKNGQPIYMVYRGTFKIVFGYDLLCDVNRKYRFCNGCKKNIENCIVNNMHIFDVTTSNEFYLANPHHETEFGLDGIILTVKQKYR